MAFDSSTSPLLTTTSVSGDSSYGLQASENLVAQPQYGLQVLDGGAGGQFEIRSAGNLLNLAQLNTQGIVVVTNPGVVGGMVTAVVAGGDSIDISDPDGAGGAVTISVVPSTTLQLHQTQVNGSDVGTPYDTINFVNGPNITFEGVDGGDYASVTATASGLAANDGPYVITQADSDLPDATNLGALSTGLVLATVSTGVATLSTTLAPTISGVNFQSGTIPIAAINGGLVTLTTTQTISGQKTFSGNTLMANLSITSANLNMNDNKIVNVTDPTDDQDAATKAYVDAQTGSAAQWSNFPALVDVDFDGFKINNLGNPTSAQDASTKNYVDTSTILLTGAQTAAGIKTFSSPPVMSGASITSGTIPIASIVGTAMDLTTAQTAAGVKTFSSAPVMSGASITSGTIPIASVVGTAMDLTTAQTAAGIKTFSSPPVMSGALISSGTIPDSSVSGVAMTLSGTQTVTGSKTFNAQIDMNSHKIVNVTDPTSDQDAATKAYVDAAVGGGGADWSTFQAIQDVDMDSHKLINVTDPTDPQDAATKNYVDTHGGGDPSTWSQYDATQDVDMGNFKITNLAYPSSGFDAVNKSYTDNVYVSIGGSPQTINGAKTFTQTVTVNGNGNFYWANGGADGYVLTVVGTDNVQARPASPGTGSYVQTFNATPQTWATAGTIYTNRSVGIQGMVCARNTAGNPGTSAQFQFFAGGGSDGSGNAYINGTPWILSNSNVSGLSLDVVASGTNIIVQITGRAGETYDWSGFYSVVNF